MIAQSPPTGRRRKIETASSDVSAIAPEVDTTVLAPEWRGDNVPPEMAPSRAMQVSYGNSPPEALAISSSERVNDLPSGDTTPISKLRKRIVVLVLVALVMIAMALGIGLGIGLRHTQSTDAPGPSSLPNNTVTNTTIPDNSPVHGIMFNTSFAAVTRPGGNREVYFQERTGALRRALYSSQVNMWHTSTDQRLPANARNNTPLVAFYHDMDRLFLFYVASETNFLKCVDWFGDDCYLSLPDLIVATDSQDLSVSFIDDWNNNSSAFSPSIVLTYQDSSQDLVVVLGTTNETVDDWKWYYETDNFKMDGVTLATACSSVLQSDDGFTELNSAEMLCFTKPAKRSVSPQVEDSMLMLILFEYNRSVSGNSSINLVTPFPWSSGAVGTNIALIASSSSSQQAAVWYNQSQVESSHVAPSSDFPFPHFASTFANSSNNTYLYHQLSDSIIAEELWDGDTSGFWISKNITIETT